MQLQDFFLVNICAGRKWLKQLVAAKSQTDYFVVSIGDNAIGTRQDFATQQRMQRCCKMWCARHLAKVGSCCANAVSCTFHISAAGISVTGEEIKESRARAQCPLQIKFGDPKGGQSGGGGDEGRESNKSGNPGITQDIIMTLYV